jgi:branched-subunit amino acid ABC-type transport system permease component
MWIAAYALVMFLIGVVLLCFPSRVRSTFFPNWREQSERWPIHGFSLLTIRFVGLIAMLMSALGIAALMNDPTM